MKLKYAMDADGNAISKLGAVTFAAVYDNGDSGAANTINWANGNKQKIRLTADTVTLTFTDPPGAADLRLVILQDGSGGRAVTLPVTWADGTPPFASDFAGTRRLVSLFYDADEDTYVASSTGAY